MSAWPQDAKFEASRLSLRHKACFWFWRQLLEIAWTFFFLTKHRAKNVKISVQSKVNRAHLDNFLNPSRPICCAEVELWYPCCVRISGSGIQNTVCNKLGWMLTLNSVPDWQALWEGEILILHIKWKRSGLSVKNRRSSYVCLSGQAIQLDIYSVDIIRC